VRRRTIEQLEAQAARNLKDMNVQNRNLQEEEDEMKRLKAKVCNVFFCSGRILRVH
jgi:hypothetical protein